jgi:hypothetical protein
MGLGFYQLFCMSANKNVKSVEKIFCCLINTYFGAIKFNFIGLEQQRLQRPNFKL